MKQEKDKAHIDSLSKAANKEQGGAYRNQGPNSMAGKSSGKTGGKSGGKGGGYTYRP